MITKERLPKDCVEQWIECTVAPAQPEEKVKDVLVDDTVLAEGHVEDAGEEWQPTNEEDAYENHFNK